MNSNYINCRRSKKVSDVNKYVKHQFKDSGNLVNAVIKREVGSYLFAIIIIGIRINENCFNRDDTEVLAIDRKYNRNHTPWFESVF